MTSDSGNRRATVRDVAALAGVSLATVDRVINGRPGVRGQTVERVAQAIAALGFERDVSASLLARARTVNAVFLIPHGGNDFMAQLAGAVEARKAQARLSRLALSIKALPPLDAAALVEALDRLEPGSCDCAFVVAIEDGQVAQAMDHASRRGIRVMTLVSDLPAARRHGFIGINNLAAGRTAASLLGRFCGGRGKVGVIAGALGLRDHQERFQGFQSLIRAEFGAIEIVGPLESFDEDGRAEALTRTLLRQHPDLCGLYNLGAGNPGVLRALKTQDAVQPFVIAHELSQATRDGLEAGLIHVILDQNPESQIDAALLAARAALDRGAGHKPGSEQQFMQIGIFLRDNLR